MGSKPMKITVAPDIEITISDVKDTAQVGEVTIVGAEGNSAFEQALDQVPGPHGRLRSSASWNEIIGFLEQIKHIFPYRVEDPLPTAESPSWIIR